MFFTALGGAGAPTAPLATPMNDDDDDGETSSTTCPTVERSGPCQSCRTLDIS